MGRVNQEVVNQRISDMIRHEKLEKHGVHQNGAQQLRDQIKQWKAAVNKAQYWAGAVKGEC